MATRTTKGLRVGQTVDCWVENIGRLVNTIGEQSERQPNEPEVVGKTGT